MLTVESIESPQVKPVKVQAVDDVQDPLVVVLRGRVRDLVLATNVTKTFHLLLLQIKLKYFKARQTFASTNSLLQQNNTAYRVYLRHSAYKQSVLCAIMLNVAMLSVMAPPAAPLGQPSGPTFINFYSSESKTVTISN